MEGGIIMKQERRIRIAAWNASMTEEKIVREEVIKDGVHVGYKDVKLRDSDRPIARLFFRKGVEWADANQPSPWISVEERLPEEHTDVIVTDGSNVAYCRKYGDGFYTNVGKCCNVTHWMPIPELPKEDGR